MNWVQLQGRLNTLKPLLYLCPNNELPENKSKPSTTAHTKNKMAPVE